MLTKDEIEKAKLALSKMRPPMDGLSNEDKFLLEKYPRHTLEQAREIDGTTISLPLSHPGQDLGYTSGFDKLMAQERGDFHLSGNHT